MRAGAPGGLALLAAVACLLAAGQAGAGPPTRAQTLGEDLSGPRLDLLGTVAERFRDGDDTCFVLNVGGGGWSGLAEGRLLACYPGPFDDPRFAPGQALRVTGTLGAARARSVAGRVLDYPVAAGAFLYPAPEPGYYDYGPYYPGASPWYYGPGYSYAPYGGPFYWGAWYGQGGWNRSGWGVWMGR